MGSSGGTMEVRIKVHSRKSLWRLHSSFTVPGGGGGGGGGWVECRNMRLVDW